MKLLKIFALFTALTVCCSCGAKSNAEEETPDQGKVLVVYFSATGHTKAVAEKVARATGGTLYEIQPDVRYTDADLDWRNDNSRSSIEMRDPASRPALGGEDIDVSEYDMVFIGYPIWWDLAPRQINTFIETHNLADKKLVPFATSGGSTIDGSVNDLKRLYPDLNWAEGKLLNHGSQPEVWAKTIGK